MPATTVRIGNQTDLTLLNLDEQIEQFQIMKGTLVLRSKRKKRQQVYEVDTPNLVLTVPNLVTLVLMLNGNVVSLGSIATRCSMDMVKFMGTGSGLPWQYTPRSGGSNKQSKMKMMLSKQLLES
ncbi:hypothetical protein [Legionella parisiensis]|uniref:Uncharacterized protein n=1 Tax=Legionella parisiensis TaxID=45071 RepID=A0A1E5JSD8_9GAMM|nr:hypothetical protein [Legionella parisiensis]KTD41484.1 hypothetical protein Lpar_2801 [Legionella parisiensis]OEH46948.1 hypothetical protein lpari_02150 [Legionella parisiensis]STX76198.1 Uncharacterised protein [Legionella parisiensis]